MKHAFKACTTSVFFGSVRRVDYFTANKRLIGYSWKLLFIIPVYTKVLLVIPQPKGD